MTLLGLKFPSPSGWITSRRVRQRQAEQAKNKTEEEADLSRLREWLPMIGTWFKSSRLPAEHDPYQSFIPNPKVTFIVHSPQDLVCGICQITELKFQHSKLGRVSRRRKAAFCDSVPVIAPCGHVAGSECMEKWLEENETCPFCREQLVHECGHRIPLQPITTDNIYFIPPTIPAGGSIPESCKYCYETDLFATAMARQNAAQRRFADAMAAYDITLLEDDLLAMLNAKEDFENLMSDHFRSPRLFRSTLW